MSRFLTPNDTLPQYLMFPAFLLGSGLNETAMLLYAVLLDRARLSMTRGGWTDGQEHVYLIYPVRDLAARLHKSEMTIKTALSALESAGLLSRKRRGIGQANLIYLKLPDTEELPADRNLSTRQTENCPSDGKKTVCQGDRKLSTNKNYGIKTNLSRKALAPKIRSYECDEDALTYHTINPAVVSPAGIVRSSRGVPEGFAAFCVPPSAISSKKVSHTFFSLYRKVLLTENS